VRCFASATTCAVRIDRRVEAVAAAVSDRRAIDWKEASAGIRRPAAREALRDLARVADVIGPRPVPASDGSAHRARLWVPATAVAAGVKLVILGVLAAAIKVPAPDFAVGELRLIGLDIAVFFAAGVFLWIGGRRDVRALLLGTFFLLVAEAFAHRPLELLIAAGPPSTKEPLSVLAALPAHALLVSTLAGFVRCFPRAAGFTRADSMAHTLEQAGFAMATALFTCQILAVTGVSSDVVRGLAMGDRRHYYWLAIFACGFPLVPIAFWRIRHAPAEDRRRGRLFLAAIAVGLMPMASTAVLAFAHPAMRRILYVEYRWPLALVVHAGLASIPLTTGYAVLVHRVLDVRIVVGQALRYLFARASLVAVGVGPLVTVAVYGYAHRDLSVSALVSGKSALIATAAAAFSLLAIRGRLAAAIDRRFFRESVDGASCLARLAEASRDVSGIRDLAGLALREIENAYHPVMIGILVRDDPSGTFVPVAGPARPLPLDSAVAVLLASLPEPLDVNLEHPRSLTRLLPLEERDWLAEHRTRVVIPLLGQHRAVGGFLAVGEKQSDLAYSAADRQFLRAVAAAVALGLGNREALHDGSWRQARTLPGGAAHECQQCHAVSDADGSACACGGLLAPAALPRVLAGKFRVEHRLGQGGMGIVYRARDLALGREVALKTLPRVEPESSLRLRREARAMAAVIHPHVAVLYGLESWRGVPVLVSEYLEGGTLRDRLGARRLEPREAIDLGIALADAVAHLHGAGILHRDIKPSNIGFGASGSPKILDLGLARLLEQAVTELPDETRDPRREWARAPDGDALLVSHRGRLVGTPLYLSPEAVAGRSAGPSFDLWSLALTLFEAVAGQHPFKGRTIEATLDRIARAALPDIEQLRPACPPTLSAFFVRALAKDPSTRFPTAIAFAQRLRAI
jgi:hypothetical protein